MTDPFPGVAVRLRGALGGLGLYVKVAVPIAGVQPKPVSWLSAVVSVSLTVLPACPGGATACTTPADPHWYPAAARWRSIQPTSLRTGPRWRTEVGSLESDLDVPPCAGPDRGNEADTEGLPGG